MKPTRFSGELKFEVVDGVGPLGERAAGLIQAELKRKPDLLLCASAGGTPTGTYGALATRAARDPQQFRSLRILQIDEWAGLPAKHPATCDSDLRSKLLEPLRAADAWQLYTVGIETLCFASLGYLGGRWWPILVLPAIPFLYWLPDAFSGPVASALKRMAYGKIMLLAMPCGALAVPPSTWHRPWCSPMLTLASDSPARWEPRSISERACRSSPCA